MRRVMLILLLTCCSLSVAQTAEELATKANAAYARKDWKEAAELYAKVAAKDPSDANSFYNAACSYALGGDKEKAFEYLDQAIDHGFGNVENLKGDSDLTSLREDPRWATVVTKAEKKAKFLDAIWNTPSLNTPYKDDLSEEEKIAGLSKFWSEVRYNFAYYDQLPALDWDGLYLQYIPKVRAAKSTSDYYLLLQELCAKLRDGHTNVMPPERLWDARFSSPAMRTRMFEDKVLVIEVFDPKLTSDGVVPGVEITEIDGVAVKQYAEQKVKPYQSASTEQDLINRTYGMSLLYGAADETVKLVFRTPAGQSFARTVARVPYSQRSKLWPSRPSFEFKMLPNKVAYVALNEFGSSKAADEFEKDFDDIAQSDALIIDIRNNGGGNSGVGYRVLATVTDKPFKSSRWSTRDYKPTYRAWGRSQGDFIGEADEVPANGSKLYTKPVVVLTSARTFSAAEDFAVAFDYMKRGMIVGEATGGSTGQPLMFKLPGGGSARVCTKRDTYPDGKVFVGVGIQPNIRVQQSAADFRDGKDTVLDAALQSLKSKSAVASTK